MRNLGGRRVVGYSRIMTRRTVPVIFAAAMIVTMGATAWTDSAHGVTCRVPDDPSARVWTLEPAGTGWRMSFRGAEIRQAPVRLALPGARPEVSASAARLSYKNANGGRQVDLAVGSGQAARFEVWVDHGLEVNIEPDLDPRVDLMNTHGPLEGVQCTIAPFAP
jgi:hypothetical protein